MTLWRKSKPKGPEAEEFVIGPFELSGILLARFPHNHPAFVAAAVEFNRRNTYERFEYTGVIEPARISYSQEYRRALEGQNSLPVLGRRPRGILALLNNTQRGYLQPLGYGYTYPPFTADGRHAVAIGNLLVGTEHVGEGIGALIARELIRTGGAPWVTDPNDALRLLPDIDPPPNMPGIPAEAVPAPAPPIWRDEVARGAVAVIRDINRVYPDLPPYTVVRGTPQNA